MAITEKLLTAEAFEQLPDEGKRYELIDGELREMAPTVNWHGEVEINLGTLLNVHVRPQGLGRVSCGKALYIVRRDPDRLRAADIAFLRQNRGHPLRHGSTLWRLSQTSWSRSSMAECLAPVMAKAERADLSRYISLLVLTRLTCLHPDRLHGNWPAQASIWCCSACGPQG
jgi:hypothetical protein